MTESMPRLSRLIVACESSWRAPRAGAVPDQSGNFESGDVRMSVNPLPRPGLGAVGALAFAALTLAWPATPALAASFDCKRAKAPIEQEICGLPELSALDDKLASLYADSLKVLRQANPAQVVRLQKDQRAWISIRNDCYDMIHGDPEIWAEVNVCLNEKMRSRVETLRKIIAAKSFGR
jgi:uncharacterized protein YecT (DUF1311 family)